MISTRLQRITSDAGCLTRRRAAFTRGGRADRAASIGWWLTNGPEAKRYMAALVAWVPSAGVVHHTVVVAVSCVHGQPPTDGARPTTDSAGSHGRLR